MIDRALLRDNPDLIRQSLARRHFDYDLDGLIALETRRRELLQVEALRAQRNELSKQIGQVLREGGSADELKAQVHALAEQIAAQEAELAEVEAQFEQMMATIPNILHPDVPEGASEEENRFFQSMV